MDMVRCQDCGQVVPEWFITEIAHGGIFGEGSTATCRRCSNREWPPLPEETEEEYRVRMAQIAMGVAVPKPWSHWKWRMKIALGSWPKYVVDALENVRWSGARVAGAIHGIVEGARKVVVANNVRQDDSSATTEPFYGPGLRDDSMPHCPCGGRLTHICRIEDDKWEFCCEVCCPVLADDYWPIGDIPALIAQYAMSAEQSKRRRKVAKKKLNKAIGEAESAYSFTRQTAGVLAQLTAERDELKALLVEANADMERRRLECAFKVDDVTERCRALDARVAQMTHASEAAEHIWQMMDDIVAAFGPPPYADERVRSAVALAGGRLRYAAKINGTLAWRAPAEPGDGVGHGG